MRENKSPISHDLLLDLLLLELHGFLRLDIKNIDIRVELTEKGKEVAEGLLGDTPHGVVLILKKLLGGEKQ